MTTKQRCCAIAVAALTLFAFSCGTADPVEPPAAPKPVPEQPEEPPGTTQADSDDPVEPPAAPEPVPEQPEEAPSPTQADSDDPVEPPAAPEPVPEQPEEAPSPTQADSDDPVEPPAAPEPVPEQPEEAPDPTQADSVEEGASDVGPVRFGFLAGLSGDYAEWGPASLDGAQTAISVINEAGGILGREVELVVQDNLSTAQGAVTGYTRIREEIHALGGVESDGAVALLSTVAEDEMPTMCAVCGTTVLDTEGGNFVWRITASDTTYGLMSAQLARDLGFTRVAMLVQQTEGTETPANAFRDVWESKVGGEIIADVRFAPGGDSYQTEVRQALSGDPQAVYIGAGPHAGIPIIRDYIAGGYDVQILVSPDLVVPAIAETAAALPTGRILAPWITDDFDSPAYAAFAAAHQEYAGKPPPTGFYETNEFDQYIILALAMTAAGTTDGAAVAAQVPSIVNAPGTKVYTYADGVAALERGEEIDYDGPSSSLELNATGNLVSPTFVVLYIVNGEYAASEGFIELDANLGRSLSPVPQAGGAEAGFGSGIWEVGAEVAPGVYQTVVPDGDLCLWQRQSGVSGDFDDILANGLHEGGDRVVVEILPTDAWFSSDNCGRWQPHTASPAPAGDGGPSTTDAPEETAEPATPGEPADAGFGSGIWEVGAEVAPGVYQTVVPDGDLCLWQRQSGVSGDFDDILANGLHEGGDRVVVEILPTDAWFSSDNCGRWQPHTASPELAEAGFGSGIWEVGAEVAPGVYQTVVPDGDLCLWQRQSGVSGDFDDILANGLHEGGDRVVVEILPTDAWFSSDNCGRWQPRS